MKLDGWRSAELGELALVNPEQLGSRTNPDYRLEYLDIAAITRPGFIGPSQRLPSPRHRVAPGDVHVRGTFLSRP